MEHVETVIVGGGQAGLSLSYHLSRLGRPHVILERARIGESWRSERWDLLMFQFPNWAIRLAGYGYQSDDPHGFAHKDEVARFLEDYARLIQAPVRCGTRVGRVWQPRPGRFSVEAEGAALEADNVVAATGSYHDLVIPDFHIELLCHIMQLHSSAYRNPQQLPPGAVLIVGAAASGVQIAQELRDSGRTVYLSTGRYRRTPRRYRGQDLYWWFNALKVWELPAEQFPNPFFLVTGAGGGRDIDLRRFPAEGITLVGRLQGIAGSRMRFADDLEHNLARGEAWFADLRRRMDEHARTHKLDLPEEPISQPASSHSTADAAPPILELDADTAGIGIIIWATGFRYNFGWVDLPVLDDAGKPLQQRGISPCPGFYFLGLRRMHTIKSNLLEGIGEDAAYIAKHIASRCDASNGR